MNTSAEITCVGEMLVDFVSSQPTRSLAEAPGFLKAAGGAPANIAVGLARLGVRTAFVGAVGADSFGAFLTHELHGHGVDTRGVVATREGKTRLAFVAVSRTGERDFEFWERNPADQLLRLGTVDMKRILRSRIVNIGSFLLLSDPSRSTAFTVAREVVRHGGTVCFDPNLRLSLWPSRQAAKRIGLRMMRLTTILRLNAEEARLFTGIGDAARAARKLLRLGPTIVVVTEGPHGCTVAVGNAVKHLDAFRVHAVDTTGCGDGFLAGLLAGIVRSKRPVNSLSITDLVRMCRFAQAVGALVAMGRGAIPAMPSAQMVRKFLKGHT